MNDPIRIDRTGPESEQLLTAEEIMALDKARFGRRMSAGFAIFLAVVALALLAPLVVFLVRLASG